MFRIFYLSLKILLDKFPQAAIMPLYLNLGSLLIKLEDLHDTLHAHLYRCYDQNVKHAGIIF